MKYIRTKDGCITEGNFEIGKTIATLYGDEQITQENTADTIEELCDEFVVVLTNKFLRKHSYRKMKKIRLMNFELAKANKIIFENIYGAVWIKGEHDEPILKSVAKLNEKGEFDLL